MEPVTFVGQQKILFAPSNWDAKRRGRCEGLPVAMHHGCIYSCWQFTWRERLQILFGKQLSLIISGDSMPPVAMEISEFSPPIKRSDGIPRPSSPPSHKPYG